MARTDSTPTEPTPAAETTETLSPQAEAQPVEVSPEAPQSDIPTVTDNPNEGSVASFAKQGEPSDVAGPGLAPVSERAEYQDQSVLKPQDNA